MIEKSNYISQIFIKFVFENDIPFLNQGVVAILIVYKYKKQLFNIHLIFGFTEGLYSKGILYSVVFISDENFKKNYKRI
jgi:hypothetical protein